MMPYIGTVVSRAFFRPDSEISPGKWNDVKRESRRYRVNYNCLVSPFVRQSRTAKALNYCRRVGATCNDNNLYERCYTRDEYLELLFHQVMLRNTIRLYHAKYFLTHLTQQVVTSPWRKSSFRPLRSVNLSLAARDLLIKCNARPL